MKQETKLGFIPLSAPALKTLCNETKETKLTEKQFKKFSAVDLWAIQKNRKTTVVRGSIAV